MSENGILPEVQIPGPRGPEGPRGRDGRDGSNGRDFIGDSKNFLTPLAHVISSLCGLFALLWFFGGVPFQSKVLDLIGTPPPAASTATIERIEALEAENKQLVGIVTKVSENVDGVIQVAGKNTANNKEMIGRVTQLSANLDGLILVVGGILQPARATQPVAPTPLP
jgi:hypothetical protein